MERSIKEQVGAATWESWPVGARMAIADAQATIAALQASNAAYEKACDAYEKQLTQRTAELEAANGSIEAARRVNNDLQAKLERVRAERDHAKKMEAIQKEVADNQTWHVQKLSTLIAALPKVEGEIVAQAGYVKDRKKVYACFGADADMTAYAALLTHRQGMERYRLFPGGELGMHPTGEWTPYKDAQRALEADNAALREDLLHARQKIAELEKKLHEERVIHAYRD